MSEMRPCHLVEIVTPKKYVLNGLWFGPKKPRRVVIWVHGLGSSMFSKLNIVELLADGSTVVLTFNNRGHDKVTGISTTSGRYTRGGAVHEVFTDCVDDIQGAVNFVRKNGVRRIYLAGHSTGCQKLIFYMSKKPRHVRAVIILGPMSDYDAENMTQGKGALKRAEKVARQYMRQGKKHTLLPENVWKWPWIADAQRFLSLYTGEGSEEIFTYWDPKRHPRALASVRAPLLVVLAEREEFSDMPAEEIAAWFKKHTRSKRFQTLVVPRVGHSFRGGEKTVAREIRRFIRES